MTVWASQRRKIRHSIASKEIFVLKTVAACFVTYLEYAEVGIVTSVISCARYTSLGGGTLLDMVLVIAILLLALSVQELLSF